jgi:uncharacterized membrane protein
MKTKSDALRHAVFAIIVALICALAGTGAVLSKSTPTPSMSSQRQQPQMESALNYLHQALQALNSANPDKGGHRNRAINAVQEAINQVKAGMQAAP